MKVQANPAPPRRASWRKYPAGRCDDRGGDCRYLTAYPDSSSATRPAAYADPPQVDRGNGVVDFQRYMVARLQSDVDRLTLENTALVTRRGPTRTASRASTRRPGADRGAPAWASFLEILTGDLMDILDVDVIAMVVESNGVDLPHVAASGICIVEPGGSATGWVGPTSGLQSAVVGDAAIYGPAPGWCRASTECG